jgi:hypothetical protein
MIDTTACPYCVSGAVIHGTISFNPLTPAQELESLREQLAACQRENESLRKANLDCVDWFNAARERAEVAERSLAAYKHDAEALLQILKATALTNDAEAGR